MKTMMKSMMKRYQAAGLIIAVCGLALLPLVIPATATTFDECKAAIQLVRNDTTTVTILKNADNHRKTLLSKLDSADLKLSQAQFLDAIKALNDYKSLVNDLVNPKGNSSVPLISATDAAMLTAAADDAIACIRNLCGC